MNNIKDDTTGFYQLRDRSFRNTLHVRSRHSITGTQKLRQGDYTNVTFPLIATYYQGWKIRDVIAFNGIHFLISDRVKDIFESNGLTGWKSFPVKVYNKKKEEVLGYNGFSITGRTGPIYKKEKHLFKKRYAPTGPLVDTYKGIFFDLNGWDGSDFFLPVQRIGNDPEGVICMTQKSYRAIKEAKVDTFSLEHLPDVEKDPHCWDMINL